jgi:hypothetical protein
MRFLTFLIVLISVKLCAQTNDFHKIDSLFNLFDTSDKNLINCTLDYNSIKKGKYGPDIDVFDRDYGLIISKITKIETLKLIDYYTIYCKKFISNESRSRKLEKKLNQFLTTENFNLEINYKTINGLTVGIICYIYSEEQYIFFKIVKNE